MSANSATLATWNINSVRRRPALVERFVATHDPDVICLQEIKCANGSFPAGLFRKLGYEHQAVHGQKAYHGVATLSRWPFQEVTRRQFCGKEDARHIAVSFGGDAPAALDGVSVHNFYVPAGGDEPDPDVNEKFDHKLRFLTEMRAMSQAISQDTAAKSVLMGDLNVAPLETDVWSHKKLLNVVSHTPIEVEHLDAVQQAGNWVDVVRHHIPPHTPLYSWWSYRAKDWRAADKGRRLDHIWASPALAPRAVSAAVVKDVRGWDEPSDHAPVVVELAE
jgi:exodeoxyribonuclease-3